MQDKYHGSTDPYSIKLIYKLERLNLKSENKVDIEFITKALEFAKKYHDGQYRQSGDPYYTHPIEVAYMVADHCFKTEVIATSLLHDVLEDTVCTYQDLKDNFGSLVASQVESLTRIKSDKKISSKEIVEHLYMQKDKDIMIVKLYDRLHNIQTIKYHTAEKQKRIIEETMQNFIAAAAYLEMYNLEEELGDLCNEILQGLSDANKNKLHYNVFSDFINEVYLEIKK